MTRIIPIAKAPDFNWRALGLTDQPAHLPDPDSHPTYPEGCLRVRDLYAGTITPDQITDDDRTWLLSEIQRIDAETRSIGRKYFASVVPRRYSQVTPDDTARGWARQVAADHHATPGLLILGPTGTGKTHVAWATLRALSEIPCAITNQWRAVTAVDLYASLRPGGVADPDAELRRLCEVPLLFIDDLAAAKSSEWTEEVTYRIINRRYEECLPLVATSNVQPGQLAERLGDRVASRLTEMCTRVVLKGDDRRRRGGAR